MKLTQAKTIIQLSKALGISLDDINYVLENKSSLVTIQEIVKRRKRNRIVFVAKGRKYNKLLRSICDNIAEIITFRDCVQGFTKGRGIITNATKHLNKKVIINLDIKDYFQSIKTEYIVKALQTIGFHKKIIPTVMELVTFENALPTGFSSSPVISNVICYDLDTEFLEFAEKNNCVYTRYGDDISLSMDEDKSIKKEELVKILNNFGFILNEKKYAVQKRGKKMVVTGLTVCEKDKPRLPKQMKRKLRQEAYFVKKFGYENHIERIGIDNSFFPCKPRSIAGWIAFTTSVEPKLAKYVEKNTDFMFREPIIIGLS